MYAHRPSILSNFPILFKSHHGLPLDPLASLFALGEGDISSRPSKSAASSHRKHLDPAISRFQSSTLGQHVRTLAAEPPPERPTCYPINFKSDTRLLKLSSSRAPDGTATFGRKFDRAQSSAIQVRPDLQKRLDKCAATSDESKEKMKGIVWAILACPRQRRGEFLSDKGTHSQHQ